MVITKYRGIILERVSGGIKHIINPVVAQGEGFRPKKRKTEGESAFSIVQPPVLTDSPLFLEKKAVIENLLTQAKERFIELMKNLIKLRVTEISAITSEFNDQYVKLITDAVTQFRSVFKNALVNAIENKERAKIELEIAFLTISEAFLLALPGFINSKIEAIKRSKPSFLSTKLVETVTNFETIINQLQADYAQSTLNLPEEIKSRFDQLFNKRIRFLIEKKERLKVETEDFFSGIENEFTDILTEYPLYLKYLREILMEEFDQVVTGENYQEFLTVQVKPARIIYEASIFTGETVKSISNLEASINTLLTGSVSDLTDFLEEIRAILTFNSREFSPVWHTLDHIYDSGQISSDKPTILYTTEQTIVEEEKSDIADEIKYAVVLPKNDLATYYVIGDLHGDFEQLKRILLRENILEKLVHGEQIRLIFLGDYIDRGEKQLELIMGVFILKRLFPDSIILNRGNHEDKNLNLRYGFVKAVIDRFGEDIGKTVLDSFYEVFKVLPYFTLGRKSIFIHGGMLNFQNFPAPRLSLFYFLAASNQKSSTLWGSPKNLIEPVIYNDEENILVHPELYSWEPGSLFQFNSARQIAFVFNPLLGMLEMSKLGILRMFRAHDLTENPELAKQPDSAVFTLFSTGGSSTDAFRNYRELCRSPYYARLYPDGNTDLVGLE